MEELKAQGESLIPAMMAEGLKEVIIREGSAANIYDPEKVTISGTIDAPARWLEKRTVDTTKCNVLVDREYLGIQLTINEDDHFKTEVRGSLKVDPIFEKFGINSGKWRTPFEMAEFIKMNRTYFESIPVAMELVSALKNIKTKIDKAVEASDNNRGDKRILIDQTVKTNVPEKFVLCMPLFKGREKLRFEVEIYFNPSDVSCSLVSPEANDETERVKNSIIDDVLNRIEKVYPGIVIIEK